jgi:Tfp pilus assembly protein PilN
VRFQINIYKPGKRPKVKIPREPTPTRFRLQIFLGMIMLVVLGFAYLYSAQIAPRKRRIQADQKQIMILRGFLKEVEEGQNQKSGVEALLLQVQGQRVLWKDKLVELSQLVPEDIRLTHLSVDVVETTPDRKKPREKVKETILTMKGEILTTPEQESLDHIARLITNLNESPAFSTDFDPMALVYTQRVKTGKREYMEFELSGRLRPMSIEG